MLGRDRTPAADVGVVTPARLFAARATRTPSGRPPRAPRASALFVRGRLAQLSGPRVGLRRTPWPRLKMWPGRPPRALEHVERRLDARSHGPSSTAGSRLPCTPRSSPSASQPRSSSMRQSRPITSPPAAAIGRAARRRPCRSGSSARRRRRGCARCAAARLARSRRARARRPRSRRAGSRRRRPRPARAGSATKHAASTSISACHASGSRYISAFAFVKSRDGLPSTR